MTVYFGCGLYQKDEVKIQSADPKLKKIGKWMCSYIFYIKIKCVSYECDFIWLFLIDLFQLTDRPPYQLHQLNVFCSVLAAHFKRNPDELEGIPGRRMEVEKPL